MTQGWQVLDQMIQGKDVVVTRVEMAENGIALEGRFELPPLAKLSADDQVFIAAFVGAHGSIKEMERLFGVSYPTIKARLRRITEQLAGLGLVAAAPVASDASILDRVANRELTVDEAVEELKQCSR